MIRCVRDAIGTILGWMFQGFVEMMWPKRKPDPADSDGEPNS